MIDQERFTILRETRLLERVIANKMRLLSDADTKEERDLLQAQINDLQSRKGKLASLLKANGRL